jgi:hypothetical protein
MRRYAVFMHSHELLREVVHQANPKEVSEKMGLSLSMIYKWTEPAGDGASGAQNPLDRLEQLIRATNDPRLAQWISERAGGFFIRNPKAHWPHPFYLVPATNQVVQEFADLLSVVAQAAADNSISKEEARTIRRRWEELKSATEGFVHACEEGNFSALKKELEPGQSPQR